MAPENIVLPSNYYASKQNVQEILEVLDSKAAVATNLGQNWDKLSFPDCFEILGNYPAFVVTYKK